MPICVIEEKCLHTMPCPLIRLCPEGAISQNNSCTLDINHRLCVECGKCIRNCKGQALKYTN